MGKRGGADTLRRVPGPAGADTRWNVATGDLASDLDQIEHRPAAASANVYRRALAALQESVKREHVRVSEIADVDIIADAGAVRGRIVVAEDRECLALACRGVQQQRNGMGFGNMTFADLTFRIRAGRIEV